MSPPTSASRRLARALVPAAVVAAAAWIAGPAAGEGDAPARSDDQAISRTLAAAAARATPYVVRIRPAEGAGPEEAASGVVIAPEVVATSASNAARWAPPDEAGAAAPELVVETAAGQVVPATLRGVDRRLRVVLVEVPGLLVEPAPRARGPHPPGSLVLALGTGLGPRATATFGIVSAVERFEGRAYQVDAAQDASNDGGALVDLEGGLVGVMVHVDERLGERSGVAFAVPVDRIDPVIEPLLRGFELEPGRLGLVIPREDDDEPGVRVRAVVPGTAAATAGLASGDRILRLGDVATPDLRRFRVAVADVYAGRRITVRLVRDGVERELELVVGPR